MNLKSHSSKEEWSNSFFGIDMWSALRSTSGNKKGGSRRIGDCKPNSSAASASAMKPLKIIPGHSQSISPGEELPSLYKGEDVLSADCKEEEELEQEKEQEQEEEEIEEEELELSEEDYSEEEYSQDEDEDEEPEQYQSSESSHSIEKPSSLNVNAFSLLMIDDDIADLEEEHTHLSDEDRERHTRSPSQEEQQHRQTKEEEEEGYSTTNSAKPGDNLWKISRSKLKLLLVDYWRQLTDSQRFGMMSLEIHDVLEWIIEYKNSKVSVCVCPICLHKRRHIDFELENLFGIFCWNLNDTSPHEFRKDPSIRLMDVCSENSRLLYCSFDKVATFKSKFPTLYVVGGVLCVTEQELLILADEVLSSLDQLLDIRMESADHSLGEFKCMGFLMNVKTAPVRIDNPEFFINRILDLMELFAHHAFERRLLKSHDAMLSAKKEEALLMELEQDTVLQEERKQRKAQKKKKKIRKQKQRQKQNHRQ